MPPKGKKAAKSADEEEGGDLGVEEKLVKAQLEIESLQRELGTIILVVAREDGYRFSDHEHLTHLSRNQE